MTRKTRQGRHEGDSHGIKRDSARPATLYQCNWRKAVASSTTFHCAVAISTDVIVFRGSYVRVVLFLKPRAILAPDRLDHLARRDDVQFSSVHGDDGYRSFVELTSRCHTQIADRISLLGGFYRSIKIGNSEILIFPVHSRVVGERRDSFEVNFTEI